MAKISNKFLYDCAKITAENPSYSLKDCCKSLGYSESTSYGWYKKLKDGTWSEGYSKTEDQNPLSQDAISKFLNCFVFTENATKILKKLVSKNILLNKQLYIQQMKFLKGVYKKYPNVDFWLNVDFGEKRDSILYYIGKNEKYIHEKYLDFNRKDCYTKFEYNYKPEKIEPKEKKKRSIWDHY